jgi:erythritol transport system ATP-binding protein
MEKSEKTVLENSSINADADIILHTEGITKLFPGTIALDQVNYKIYRGKINVLVGENGAGKSTLMKILVGNEKCTKGKVVLEKKEINLNSPQDAMNYGISIIHQELDLCPNMNIAENIFLGREIVNRGMIDEKKQRDLAQKLIQRLEQKINPNTLVSELRVGAQQIVTIAKALSQDARILVMDEPTSALSTSEVETLFRVIYELKEHGITIIYISHKLDEVLRIGDYITVLRDGHIVAEDAVKNINMQWVIEKMIGRKLERLFVSKKHKIGKVLLNVEKLTLPRVGGGYVVNNVSFKLNEGEILGIYGLKGAGRSELLECLIGANTLVTGKILLEGRDINGRILDRIQSGLALVPEDRQRDGLVLTMSVGNNIILASLKKLLDRFGLYIESKKEKKVVDDLVKELSIKVSDTNSITESLSGGNQQKVVIAKGLLTNPKVLMLDEPTRGIDVGAKHEVFEIMQKLATQGYGIIFVSSELKEIMAMSDRILVMSKGVIRGEFTKDTATEEQLVNASVDENSIKNGVKL